VNALWTILGGLSSLFIFMMTIFSVVTMRKPRKISVLSTLISGIIALLALLSTVYLGGLQVNPLLALPALLLGLLFGFMRGQLVKFSLVGKQVIGRNSILFIILWGFSLGTSLLLGLLDWPLLASLGLIPVFTSTGLQIGFYVNLFLRRVVILLGARPAPSSGSAKMLNLTPAPSPDPFAGGRTQKRNTWSVVVIVIISACLLLTALGLFSMVMWETL